MKYLLIFSLFISTFLTGCSFGDGDILIIPKNFRGYIVIIYDQKSGVLPKFEGRKTVYEIPSNGILKTRIKINTGWREPTEFYYEKIDKKNMILSYLEISKIPNNITVGFEGASGGANKDYEGKDVVRFTHFYVGTKIQIQQYKEQAEKLEIVKLAEQ
jgi:hypothetical protein